MKLARLGMPGAKLAACVADGLTYHLPDDTDGLTYHLPDDTDGLTYHLPDDTDDLTGAFFATDGIARVRRALTANRIPVLVGPSAMQVGPPLAAARPDDLYRHELRSPAAASGAAPPKHPVMFLKTSNTVGGPDDPVTIPKGSTRIDWEAELGVVIGTHTSYLASPAQSLAHVAGFVIADHLSERDFQLVVSGGQWSKGECTAGFSSTGPWPVPADEVDHRALRLRSGVNGEPRQDSSTADMIFDAELS